MDAVATPPSVLQPLPYQRELADHLAVSQPAAWAWFSEDLGGPEHSERVRLELLKATYRIGRDSRPQLYELADQVCERLQITAPVTFYQMQRTPGDGLNAALFYLRGEAHVAFVGPVQEALTDQELTALIGHELAHFVLLERWEHRFLVVEELLGALLQDQASQPVHVESFRLYQLYREIFCDRAAFEACASLDAAVSLLVKLETGSTEISAASYLRQTEEIFSTDAGITQGLSHPECHIRARALQLWSQHAEDLEPSVRAMIEGGVVLERLDLLAQRQVMELTRTLITALLRERWIRSESVLARARLFFDDFVASDAAPSDGELEPLRQTRDTRLGEYFCYVLLDFVACDRDLEEPSLAAALMLARQLNLESSFRKIATKELKLKKRNFDALEQQAERLIEAARASQAEAIS